MNVKDWIESLIPNMHGADTEEFMVRLIVLAVNSGQITKEDAGKMVEHNPPMWAVVMILLHDVGVQTPTRRLQSPNT